MVCQMTLGRLANRLDRDQTAGLGLNCFAEACQSQYRGYYGTRQKCGIKKMSKRWRQKRKCEIERKVSLIALISFLLFLELWCLFVSIDKLAFPRFGNEFKIGLAQYVYGSLIELFH